MPLLLSSNSLEEKYNFFLSCYNTRITNKILCKFCFTRRLCRKRIVVKSSMWNFELWDDYTRNYSRGKYFSRSYAKSIIHQIFFYCQSHFSRQTKKQAQKTKPRKKTPRMKMQPKLFCMFYIELFICFDSINYCIYYILLIFFLQAQYYCHFSVYEKLLLSFQQSQKLCFVFANKVLLRVLRIYICMAQFVSMNLFTQISNMTLLCHCILMYVYLKNSTHSWHFFTNFRKLLEIFDKRVIIRKQLLQRLQKLNEAAKLTLLKNDNILANFYILFDF